MYKRQNNERFNKLSRWPTAIKGAEPHKLMKPFVRKPEGFWTSDVHRVVGNGPATAIFNQANWELVEHKISYDEFAMMIEDEMPRAMAQEFERLLNNESEERRASEMALSHQLAGLFYGPTWGANAPSKNRIRNRCLLTGRPRGVYRKFGLSRIAFRDLASDGKLPGVVKSSW